ITALLTTEQIIDLERDQKVFGDWVIGKTKLLYIAHGKVKAGIDLSKFSKDNVVVKSDQIFIKMPAPKVLDANLDVEESKVYDIDKDGFFSPDVAVELQEQAESIAIDQIIESACKNNILAHANFQAESIVSNLL
ncbi:DUF4230 domain-containing protein, partial [Synechocystis salina LEGE 06155]|nr:DUF4230 domain-containing protein [Synechocystis salina LEGE 06155]